MNFILMLLCINIALRTFKKFAHKAVMEKTIIYFGQEAKVACDEKCNKAWGENNRPRVYPEISETKIFGLGEESIYPDDETGIDVDNYAYCSDDELEEAPIEPQTYEGGDAKPINNSEIGNRWCVRECERCVMSDVGQYKEVLVLRDFSKRFYNYLPHTR